VRPRLHEGEEEVDGELVARLLSEQAPGLAGLPIRRHASTGTVNAIFRLGDELYARLPLLRAWQESLANEERALSRLACRLPLETPQVVHQGRPGAGYPLRWAVYRWIPGEPYADGLVDDERQAARQLAGFVRALRAVPLDGSELRAGRRPLRELDASTRQSIGALGEPFDRAAVEAAWERALDAPVWDGVPTWIHADLLRPNLLVRGGRLAAVLDFGGSGAGDPATDLVAAWAVFGPAGRDAYREALEPGDGEWERGRGIALHQAAAIVPYYAETNPVFAALGRRTIEQALAG
jgi:aminoglycoside phosphotransferase (APT) family kinase protein